MDNRRIINQRRQGDVLLNPISEMPAGVQRVRGLDGQVVLALGESTGHAHRLLGDVEEWVAGDGRRFVLIHEGVTITHEEHDPMPVPVAPRLYEVLQQKEWSLADEWRTVVD